MAHDTWDALVQGFIKLQSGEFKTPPVKLIRQRSINPNLPNHNPNQVDWDNIPANKRFLNQDGFVTTPRNIRGAKFTLPDKRSGNTGFKTQSWDFAFTDKRTKEYWRKRTRAPGLVTITPGDTKVAIRHIFGADWFDW